MLSDETDDRRRQLVARLRLLTNRGGIWRDDLVALLEHELRDVNGYWKVDLTADVEVVRGAVRERLVDHYKRIQPEGKKPSSVSKRNRFWKSFQAALNLYGTSAGLELKSRQSRLEHPTITARTDITFALEKIADQLLADPRFVLDLDCSSAVSTGHGSERSEDGPLQANGVVDSNKSETTSPEQSGETKKWWRSRKMFAFGIPTILVLASGSVMAISLSSSGSPAPSIGNLLQTNLNDLRSTLDGYSVAFPVDKASVAGGFADRYQQAGGNNGRDVYTQALQAGGYSLSQEKVNLQLSTSSADEVTVTGIKPVNIQRAPIATGAVIDNPSGAGPTYEIGFNMDQPVPSARHDVSGRLGGPFFDTVNPGVTKGHPITLVLDFQAHAGSAAFNVEIDYSSNGNQGSQLVEVNAPGQSPRPLQMRVTGALCDSDTSDPAKAARLGQMHYGNVFKMIYDGNNGIAVQQVDSATYTHRNCS